MCTYFSCSGYRSSIINALKVIYLLRLDATERAQKILALAVVHAHHRGIHLRKTHDDMRRSESVLFKRVWWCMYVLDRRIALVLGRPFLIHDNNVEIEPNDDLEASTPEDSSNMDSDRHQNDSQGAKTSPISYLNVMVGYSNVVGKVWETLFGAASSKYAKPYAHEYLDLLVHNWLESVPPFLHFNDDDGHRSTTPVPPALFKQRFLIRLVRITFPTAK